MKPAGRISSPNPRGALGLAALALGLGGGCGTDPPVATTIEVSPESAVLADVGLTSQLTATVKDQHGQAMTDTEVAWSSSDSLTAQVSEDGLVTGREVGTATVRASMDALTADATVTVELGPRAVLRIFFRETDGGNWANSRNWMTDASLGQWYGVGTDTLGNITQLNLDRNGLAGPIPPELGALANLRELFLSQNDLTGPIPTELGNLPNLRELNLYENDLTGPIPTELGSLANLGGLLLNENDLTGPIPPELGNLANLRELSLGANGLTGPIPPQLGNLPNLRGLHLFQNGLTGPIPPELGNLASSLGQLDLGANELTGPIPPQLGNLANLRMLHLLVNELTGPLPRDLIGLPLVSFLWNQTDLCAPTDSAFQEWLDSIEVHWPNGNCDSGGPAARSALGEGEESGRIPTARRR